MIQETGVNVNVLLILWNRCKQYFKIWAYVQFSL